MVPGKEDLGLTLSLGTACEEHHGRMPSVQLNLMPAAFMGLQQKAMMPWSDLFSTSTERGSTTEAAAAAAAGRPSFLKGIDVNSAPAAEREEEAVASSPNSTVSSVSGKRGFREETATCSENNDRACSGGSDEEDCGDGSRKKLRLSKDQSAVLEESFKEHNTLNPKQKMALAKQLGLRPRQVEVWFQNRRARTKLKQTEVDCEFLKRCCENLTEENRRLQKEVHELRALKLSPQFYMHMTPPTTLTMCPSCERVAVSTTPSASAAPSSTTAAATTTTTPSEAGARSNGGGRQYPQQQQRHPFLQHRPIPAVGSGGGAAAGLPWAPMAMRAGAFLDAQSQRT